MKGIETEKVWGREHTTVIDKDGTKETRWSAWGLYNKGVLNEEKNQTIPCYSFPDMLERVPKEVPAKDGKPYMLCLNYLRYEREVYLVRLRGYVMRYLNEPFKKRGETLTLSALAKLILWLAEHGHLPKEVG
jgi:hypothetical protein